MKSKGDVPGLDLCSKWSYGAALSGRRLGGLLSLIFILFLAMPDFSKPAGRIVGPVAFGAESELMELGKIVGHLKFGEMVHAESIPVTDSAPNKGNLSGAFGLHKIYYSIFKPVRVHRQSKGAYLCGNNDKPPPPARHEINAKQIYIA